MLPKKRFFGSKISSSVFHAVAIAASTGTSPATDGSSGVQVLGNAHAGYFIGVVVDGGANWQHSGGGHALSRPLLQSNHGRFEH